MRKSLLFAAALAGVLSSCSSDDAIEAGGGAGNVDGRMPIEINLAQSSSVTTRGTGTVGDTVGGNVQNNWASQAIKVYMFDKNTLTTAKDADGAEIYKNFDFVAPATGSTGLALAEDQSVKYYPAMGTFDFIGYRIDNAAATPDEPTLNADEDSLQISITIDGSQDIMSAGALLSEEKGAELVGEGVDTARVYSAYAKRKNVDPTLVFKHLLSRLTFNVVAGNKDATGTADGTMKAVQIDSIKVISKNKGVLTVATSNGYHTVPGGLVFSSEKDSLTLMQRKTDDTDKNQDLEKLASVTLTWNEDESNGYVLKVGEALLVAPDKEYEVVIFASQEVKTGVDEQVPAQDVIEKKKMELNDVIKLSGEPAAAGFLAGSSYNVTITVYGLSKIDINTELTPWENGGEIELDPVDNPNKPTADEEEGTDEEEGAEEP